jgi:hypothetical protein
MPGENVLTAIIEVGNGIAGFPSIVPIRSDQLLRSWPLNWVLGVDEH